MARRTVARLVFGIERCSILCDFDARQSLASKTRDKIAGVTSVLAETDAAAICKCERLDFCFTESQNHLKATSLWRYSHNQRQMASRVCDISIDNADDDDNNNNKYYILLLGPCGDVCHLGHYKNY